MKEGCSGLAHEKVHSEGVSSVDGWVSGLNEYPWSVTGMGSVVAAFFSSWVRMSRISIFSCNSSMSVPWSASSV